MSLQKNSTPIPMKLAAHGRRAGIIHDLTTGLLAALTMFVLTGGLDWLAERNNIPEMSMWIGDVILSLIVGVLVTKMIGDARREKRRIFQRLLMIAEMNHNIRNSLEVIQLSAHVSHDKEAIEEIDTAVNRIHWALKEFVPAEPVLSSLPVQAPLASTGTDDSCIVARGQRES